MRGCRFTHNLLVKRIGRSLKNLLSVSSSIDRPRVAARVLQSTPPSMSAHETEAVEAMCCASCGIAEVDDIKLMDCDGCDLVRYCSDNCKEDHRPYHEELCKERVGELREELLFKQPESTHRGDCPICCLPIPVDRHKCMVQSCCFKLICKGCGYADKLRQWDENMQETCQFCRDIVPRTVEHINKNTTKRAEVNDPLALRQIASDHYNEGDYDEAFKYFTKAAELVDADAHYNLSIMYQTGHGVEKDEKKQIFHLEEAAIDGHPDARSRLAAFEGLKGRFDRAVKHFIIAANLGCEFSIQVLKEYYKEGHVSKDDFAAALRAHQAAVDATKSPQREAAANFYALLDRM